MSDEAIILRSLQQGVTAAVAGSSDTNLPVQYLFVGDDDQSTPEFTIPDDGKWLEIVWLPNNVEGGYWGQEKDHRGILRLILHWPRNGGGAYRPLELLGSITAYFKNGMRLQDVQIYAKPNFTGPLPESDEILYPVSIRYQSYRRGT